MVLKKALVFIAAVSTAGAPCIAAPFNSTVELGERRSGAVAGAYVSIPLGGQRSGRTQAGLRLQMQHNYRNAAAQSAPVFSADSFDLRIVGDRKPTFYVAGMAVTGEEAHKQNLTGASTLVTVAVLAAAAVGAVVIYNAIDGDDEQCLIPEGCP